MKPFVSDPEALVHLLNKLQNRKTGRSRTKIAKYYRSRGSDLRRDRLAVAYRWLRRCVGGVWYRGGHHVGRLNYGPAICEDAHRRGPLWLDRCILVEGGGQ